jgi:hypothetical protein
LPGAKGKPLKVPFVLSLPGGALFHFAGTWGPNVKPTPIGSNGFVIITGEPDKEIAWLHNRMPLVVPPGCYEHWLDPELPWREVYETMCEDLLEYSWGLTWEVTPITPLPSGRGASEIPEPFPLPWWRPAMGPVLAAIHHAMAEGAAPPTEAQLQESTGTPISELAATLKELEQHGMSIRHQRAGNTEGNGMVTGWTLPLRK